MAGARIHLFGPLRMTLDGRELPPPPNRKSRALLAYLLLHEGDQQPRERLTGLFWGDAEERRARQSLRQALSEVRRALDGVHDQAWIDSDDLSVTLHCRCPVDVYEFRRAAESAAAGSAAADATEQAIALADADLLPECYDDWCLEERARLQEQRIQALTSLLAAAHGDYARTRRLGTSLLAADPLREDVHRIVMEAAARAGDRAAALKQYAVCEAALERELDARPTPETVQLFERIRDGLLDPTTTEGAGALVGRAEELAALAKLLTASERSQPSAALLQGPPGVGKSRLMAELAAIARDRGWTVVEAGGDDAGRPEPYGGWATATRALLVREPGLLSAVPPTALPAIARLIPETRHLVAAAPGRQPTRADLFAGVLGLLRSAAATRPLLILLDDLQWAGQDAALLFEHVLHNAGRGALCLLGAMRDGGTDGAFEAVATRLQRAGRIVHVTLGPLTSDGVQALLRQISRNDAVADSLTDVTFAETEGNPLHVIELWRAMQEQGRLERDPSGRWRWQGRLDGQRDRLPLPLRVRAIVSARLAALAPGAREALTVGAVIGRGWDIALLEGAADAPAGGWQAALDEAVEHGLLRRTTDGFTFVHDVIRETVEREIDEVSARSLHLRVGEALERLHAEDAEAHADELAHHFERAGPRGVGRAFAYAWQSALRARAVFAHEHAIARFELALDYAEGGLVGEPLRLGEIRTELAEARARTGRVAAARRAADAALAAFAQTGDRQAELATRVRLAALFDANVDPHAVIHFCGDGKDADTQLSTDELVGAGTQTPLVAELLLHRAYARERLGEPQALRDVAERLAGIALRTGNERIDLLGRRALALFLSNYSLDQEQCAELRLQLREGYERIGEPFLAVELLADAADSLLRVGEIQRARPLAEEAVASARRLQGASVAFLTYPVLAELLLTTGELDALDALFDELGPYLGEAPSGRAIQFVAAKGVADMWRGVNTLRLEETGSHGDEVVWREMRFVGRIWACIESGARDEAKALLDQMAPLVPFEGEGMRWIVGALPLVYNYDLLGLPAEAARWCGGLARHARFQIPGGQACLELARNQRLNGEPQAASALLVQAAAHYEREGMRPFLLETLVEQAGIAQRQGDRAAATACLVRAETLAGELGMAHWLARLRRLR